MRIAFLNWNNRRFGGTGSYLSTMMPALQAAGNDVALWHEVDTPADYPLLSVPVEAPVWSVSTLGLNAAVDGLREWRPDLLFAHGLLEPSVERRVLEVAPAVLFAHDYYGTCISGLKTHTKPVATPCTRAFGSRCLAEYFPKRCGGLSPVTMVRQFYRQQDRLQLLSRYAAIVTHSNHMQQEYVKHGFAAERVFNVKYGHGSTVPVEEHATHSRSEHEPWRLVFAGRMDRLKGGSELLQSLPGVARRLERSLHLTFAGEGPARAAWAAEAAAICGALPAIDVQFRGWLASGQLQQLYAESDLLVLPSLWPEPLALVGLEAAQHGVPTVAFDVGGISDWLRSDTNGMLAPGNPPTVRGLADAIVAALHDPDTYARLRQGARQGTPEFTLERHMALLMNVFHEVVE